ncbi:hypothetical protein [Flavobacterium sp. N2820]|uniref:hypothetical protein n=1 Tax=Flavobacterium sp. N2820 TaxID=2986834 RepID=UPI0022250336|nr:hypothetical protein [Flavobacterium sp. N2820]
MTTLAKLNLDQDQYELMIFGIYSRWCESVTINHKQYQTVLANAMVNKWFIIELLKCEEEFHNLTDRYVGSPTISTQDLKNCYKETTYRLFSIKPTALLDSLKCSGSKSIRSNGVPVFTALNQN